MSKDDPTDDTNFFSSAKFGRDARVNQDTYVDLTDAKANYGQFVLSFQHIASTKTVFFKAFVTEYTETFSPSWTATTVYGRTDDIQTYGGTKRTISLAFDVPAGSQGEAYENLGRISKLVQMLYPTYLLDGDGAPTIQGQSPLVRVKMMNLVTKERLTTAQLTGNESDSQIALTTKATSQRRNIALGTHMLADNISPQELLQNYRTTPLPSMGVLAAISNFTYRSDLTKIAIFEKAPNTILPQAITVNLAFSVIHEEVLGWDDKGNPLSDSFPHKVSLPLPTSGKSVANDMNPRDVSTRMQDERDSQAEMDNARAHNARFMSSLGKGIGKGVHAYTAAIGRPLGITGVKKD